MEKPILATGTILRSLSPQHGELELTNGKVLCGHLSRNLYHQGFSWEIGREVDLEMTIYDFDKARIMGYTEK